MLVTKAISVEADDALSLNKTDLLDQIRWMQLITDNVAANIAYIDAGQRFLFVNKGVGELLGLAREDLFGRRISDVLDAVDYGELVVVHTENTTSTVFITKAQSNIAPGAMIRTPFN